MITLDENLIGSVKASAKPPVAAESLKQVEERVEDLKRNMFLLNDKIQEHSGGREEYVRKRGETRAEIDKLTVQINELEASRQALNTEVSALAPQPPRGSGGAPGGGRMSGAGMTGGGMVAGATAAGGMVRRDPPPGQGGPPTALSSEDIESRLKEIEYRRITETLSLRQDKILQQEVDKLTKLSSQLKEYNAVVTVKQQSLQAQEQSSAAETMNLVDKRNHIRDRLKVLRDNRDQLYARLQSYQSARATEMEPLRALLAQRDELREDLNNENAKLRDMTSEQRQQEQNQYAEMMRKRQAKSAEERHQKQLKSVEAEKKQLQIAIAAASSQDENSKELPASQLRDYLQDVIARFDGATTSNSATTTDPTLEDTPGPAGAADGEKIILNDEEFVVQTKRVDQMVQKKDKRGKAKAKHSAPSKYLTLSFDALRNFKKLGVDAPATVDDAREAVKALDGILAGLQKEQDAKRTLREKRLKELQQKLVASLERERELQAAPSQ